MACAMRGEAIENFELSLAYEDDTRVDQIVNAVPLRDAEGTVVGAVGASIDITSRMRAEEELKRSEARFRDFAESAADWLWETDADHRFIWMSDNVEKLTGVPPAWHYGKTRFELMRVNTGIDLTAISADTEMWADHLRTLEARLPFRDLEYLRHGPKSDHWLSVSGIPIFREDGTFGGYRGVGRDITDRKTAEHRARFLADHDPLTSLPNRRLLSDRLSAMRSQASVPGNKIALAFVDVDHFKLVNDSLGHQAGDRFLVEIGRRLSRCVGGRGLVARFGGDEFAVAIGPVGNIDKARTVCSDMLDAMREPMQADGERFIPSISIGVAIYPDDALNDENLMRNADRALYRAKNKGRDRVCFFDDDLDQLIQQ